MAGYWQASPRRRLDCPHCPIMSQPNLDLTEFDPFVDGRDYVPPRRVSPGYTKRGKSTWEAITGANPELDREAAALCKPQTKSKPKDNIKRIISHANSLGYFASRVEYREAPFSGQILKRDYLGLIDVLCFKPCGEATQLLGFQDTTKAAMKAHIRKMASSKLVAIPGLGQRPYVDMTIAFLEANGILIILGWYWANNRWHFEECNVTKSLILEAVSRKRK